MEIFNSTTAPASGLASPNSQKAAGAKDAPSFQSLLAQLNSYVKGTPSQRLWATILAQLGITPEQFQKMTPQERAKVEDEIKQIMKKDVQAQQQQLTQQQAAPTQQPGSVARTGALAKKHVSIDLEI